MKVLLAVALLISGTIGASAQYGYGTNRSGSSGSGLYGSGSNQSNTYVQPRINRDGSYTGGHHRTNPNNTQMDNYGSAAT